MMNDYTSDNPSDTPLDSSLPSETFSEDSDLGSDASLDIENGEESTNASKFEDAPDLSLVSDDINLELSSEDPMNAIEAPVLESEKELGVAEDDKSDSQADLNSNENYSLESDDLDSTKVNHDSETQVESLVSDNVFSESPPDSEAEGEKIAKEELSKNQEQSLNSDYDEKETPIDQSSPNTLITESQTTNSDNEPEPTELSKTVPEDQNIDSTEIKDYAFDQDEIDYYESLGLKKGVINGKDCLLKNDIDPSITDDFGRTNLERMQAGLAPLDKDLQSVELHHVGQKNNAPLAELTQNQHRGKGNMALLHRNDESEIDRLSFNTIRKDHWVARSNDFKK